MNPSLVILACVVSAIVPLLCILGWLNIRDKRMQKAQERFRARRTYDLSKSCHVRKSMRIGGEDHVGD